MRQQSKPSKPILHPRRALVILLVMLVLAGVFAFSLHAFASHPASSTSAQTATDTTATNAPASATTSPKTSAPPNACAGNTLSQLALISISQQHLWACNGSQTLYDSAVVTGMEQYAADLTPVGTYHVYGKQTNQDLKGCDATGCWDDPVSYWMPFLDNQYGQYGFHDATWRSNSDFGHVDINAPYTAASHGSHGCVELPLTTAKWLYNWASIGTTVTIES